MQQLIFSPGKGDLLATTPTRFKKQGFQNVCPIFDCSEIFTEVPKDVKMHALTYPDYKHHNTLKSLIYVAPNSSIVFISDLLFQRISDKKLTSSCGY